MTQEPNPFRDGYNAAKRYYLGKLHRKEEQVEVLLEENRRLRNQLVGQGSVECCRSGCCEVCSPGYRW